MSERPIDKASKYAVHVQSAVIDMLTNEDSEFYLNVEEFNDPENATAFLHAISTLVPCKIYTGVFKQNCEDHLAFNHIANRLCVQFSEGLKD